MACYGLLPMPLLLLPMARYQQCGVALPAACRAGPLPPLLLLECRLCLSTAQRAGAARFAALRAALRWAGFVITEGLQVLTLLCLLCDRSAVQGNQFCKGFGGIGGILRWKVDFLTMGAHEEAAAALATHARAAAAAGGCWSRLMPRPSCSSGCRRASSTAA